MPTAQAKTTKPRRTAGRKKKASAPTQNAARRTKRMAVRTKGRMVRLPSAGAYLEKVTTRQFVLLLAAIAVGFTLYVGHVHATKDVLIAVEQAKRENLRLHLKLNRLKGDFDRQTGPAVIYQRARALGLQEGIGYGPTLKVEHVD